jgi:apolipoprotein D and lipocalin family protein
VGTATIRDQNKPNNLWVKFPNNPSGASYDVWSTDYKSYSVVYSCEQVLPELKIEFVWILTRQVNGLNDQILAGLKSFVEKQGVPAKKFIKSEYNNCKL